MKELTNELTKFKVFGDPDELSGAYHFKHPKINGYILQIIASDGAGWEHVSVTIRDSTKKGEFVRRTPTWQEMCFVKDIFWGEHEVVIQYHPAKSDYVNNHPYCLHLWRPVDVELPVPDPIMVGI